MTRPYLVGACSMWGSTPKPFRVVHAVTGHSPAMHWRSCCHVASERAIANFTGKPVIRANLDHGFQAQALFHPRLKCDNVSPQAFPISKVGTKKRVVESGW